MMRRVEAAGDRGPCSRHRRPGAASSSPVSKGSAPMSHADLPTRANRSPPNRSPWDVADDDFAKIDLRIAQGFSRPRKCRRGQPARVSHRQAWEATPLAPSSPASRNFTSPRGLASSRLRGGGRQPRRTAEWRSGPQRGRGGGGQAAAAARCTPASRPTRRSARHAASFDRPPFHAPPDVTRRKLFADPLASRTAAPQRDTHFLVRHRREEYSASRPQPPMTAAEPAARVGSTPSRETEVDHGAGR